MKNLTAHVSQHEKTILQSKRNEKIPDFRSNKINNLWRVNKVLKRLLNSFFQFISFFAKKK